MQLHMSCHTFISELSGALKPVLSVWSAKHAHKVFRQAAALALAGSTFISGVCIIEHRPNLDAYL